MAEDATVEVTLPCSAFHHPISFSSSLRFLGLPKQADSYLNSLDDGVSSPLLPFDGELDERDVLWSYEGSFSTDAGSLGDSHSPSGHLRRLLMAGRCGLSALLAEDMSPMVRRRFPTVEAAMASQQAPVPATGRVEDKEVSSRRWIHHQSAPINVPAWPKWIRKAPNTEALEEMDYGEYEKHQSEAAVAAPEGEDEMLPPHVIVARSQAATSTFSVFEGVGRTLKGRDLRRVRNAVLQRTGFLDL